MSKAILCALVLSVSPFIMPAQAQQIYAAVAAGTVNPAANGGMYAGFGMGAGYSPEKADEVAMKECSAEMIPAENCRIVHRWNKGCYYMVASAGNNSVGWGGGATAEKALEACRERGLPCLTLPENVKKMCIK